MQEYCKANKQRSAETQLLRYLSLMNIKTSESCLQLWRIRMPCWNIKNKTIRLRL